MDIQRLSDLRNECARECALRKTYYPKMVQEGKMTQAQADERIYLMRLAAACFTKILKGNASEIQKTLFDMDEFTPAPKTRSMYEIDKGVNQ